MLNLYIYIIFIFFFSGYGFYLHCKITEKLISTHSEQILILQSQALLLESEKNKLLESSLQTFVEPMPVVVSSSSYLTPILLITLGVIVGLLSYHYLAVNQSALITEQNTAVVELVTHGNKVLLDSSGNLLVCLDAVNQETLNALASLQLKLDSVLQQQIRHQASLDSLGNGVSSVMSDLDLEPIVLASSIQGDTALSILDSILKGGGI